MLIKLNPGQPFWMLFDEMGIDPIIRLTFDEPGPLELDVTQLSPANQERLALGFFYRIITEVDPGTVEATPTAPIQIDHLIDSNPIIQAKKILQGNVHKVSAALEPLIKAHNLEMLETLRALEFQGENQNGAPRTTVLSAIDRAIHRCGGLTAIVESEQEVVELVQEDLEDKDDA